MQTVKTLSAGRYRYSVAYRKTSRTDSPKARKAKAEHSTTAQQMLNRKLSLLGLTSIIAANFADSNTAKFVTLTFDKDHYLAGLKESELYEYANAEAKLFLQRAKRLCARRQSDLKTVYAIGGGNNIRYHIHLCLDGLAGEDIRAVWDRGNADYHLLNRKQDDPKKWDWLTENGNVNPAQIATYLYENSECCPLGKHRWHASRNCVRAETEESYEIPDCTSIPCPDGAEVLNEGRDANPYSEIRILELILPKPLNVPVPTKKRKRIDNQPPISSLTWGEILYLDS